MFWSITLGWVYEVVCETAFNMKSIVLCYPHPTIQSNMLWVVTHEINEMLVEIFLCEMNYSHLLDIDQEIYITRMIFSNMWQL